MTRLLRATPRHSLAKDKRTPEKFGAAIEKALEEAVVIDRFRRRALPSVCFVLAALTSQAGAQPTSKAVTLVAPYAAGGGTDTVSRLIGDQMSRALGRPVIIENVVGGGGTIANDRVARSGPDRSPLPTQSRR